MPFAGRNAGGLGDRDGITGTREGIGTKGQTTVMRLKALLAISLAMLGGLGLATRSAGGQSIPVEGIYDLVRGLLARRADTSRSERIRLVDSADGLDASLEIAVSGERELFGVFSFGPTGRKIFVHTVRFRDSAGRAVLPRVIDLKPLGEQGRGELVVAQIPAAELDWLADATSLEVELQGWDVTFDGAIDEKGVRKIRAFRDRRRAGATK